MKPYTKEELVKTFGFGEIEDSQFDVLNWQYHERVGTTELSATIQFEREKGTDQWELGTVQASGVRPFKSIDEALMFIQNINNSK